MVQLFLLLVDRDCVDTRRHNMDVLEKKSQGMLKAGQILLAENAW